MQCYPLTKSFSYSHTTSSKRLRSSPDRYRALTISSDAGLESQRLKRARLRLAEAQGIIPIGASENSSVTLEVVKRLLSTFSSLFLLSQTGVQIDTLLPV